MPIKPPTIATFTRPQLEQALDQLGDKALAPVADQLGQAKQPFLVDLLEEVGGGKRTAVGGKALRQAVAKQLAAIEAELAVGGGKGKGKSLDLGKVGQRFGKVAADLLAAVNDGWRSGAIELNKRRPMDRDLALRVRAIYEELGAGATSPKVVARVAEFYPGFTVSALHNLRYQFPNDVPDPASINAKQVEARQAAEAKALAKVMAEVGREPSAVVGAMKRRGFTSFNASRIPYLRRRFPELLRSKLALDEGLAREVARVYAALGGAASSEKVVAAMAQRDPRFTASTLNKLHAKFKTILPDRQALNAAQQTEAKRREAEKVAQAWRAHDGDRAAIVAALREAGYREFSAARIDRLRLEFPDLVPRAERVAPRASEAKARRQTALAVAGLLDKLGANATDEALIRAARRELGSFNRARLKELRREFGSILPSAEAVTRNRKLAAYRAEAEHLRQVMQEVGSERAAIIAAMKQRGFRGFDKDRVDFLRRKFPELIGEAVTRRGADDYAALAARVRAYLAAHPQANQGQVAEAVGVSRGVLNRVLADAGLEVAGAASGKKVLKTADPLQRVFILRAFFDAKPNDMLTDIAAALNAQPAFVERFGKVSGGMLSAYVKEVLGREIPDWTVFRRQQVTRAVVQHVRTARRGAPLREALAAMAERYGKAPAKEWCFQDLLSAWNAHPELYPEANALRDASGAIDWTGRGEPASGPGSARPGVYDRAYAELVAWYFAQGCTTEQVVMLVGLFDPRFDQGTLERLRLAFPGLSLLPGSGGAGAPTPGAAELYEQVSELLRREPNATTARVATALGCKPAEVALAVQKLKAVRRSQPATPYSSAELGLIAETVRRTPPGEGLDWAVKVLRQNQELVARHPDLDRATVIGFVGELVPEAGDWQAFQLQRVAEVVHETLTAHPELRSVSELCRAARQSYPGFPEFQSFARRTMRDLHANLERLPVLHPYVGASGTLLFVEPEKRAGLTRELAELVAEHARSAPSIATWPLVAARVNEDPRVEALGRRLLLEDIVGLRAKFPGVIPKIADANDDQKTRDQAYRLGRLLQEQRGVPDVRAAAKAVGIGDTRAQELIAAFPAYFPFYKKRYPLTPHLAQIIGEELSRMPMGTTLEQAAHALQFCRRLPANMLIAKTTILNAQRKFPDLVPSLEQQSQDRFEEYVARMLFVTDPFFSRHQIFKLIEERFEQVPIGEDRFNAEVYPRWRKWLAEGTAPPWLSAIAGANGELPEFGLGRGEGEFPARELWQAAKEVKA